MNFGMMIVGEFVEAIEERRESGAIELLIAIDAHVEHTGVVAVSSDRPAQERLREHETVLIEMGKVFLREEVSVDYSH
jgi:hypothetical protein